MKKNVSESHTKCQKNEKQTKHTHIKYKLEVALKASRIFDKLSILLMSRSVNENKEI